MLVPKQLNLRVPMMSTEELNPSKYFSCYISGAEESELLISLSHFWLDFGNTSIQIFQYFYGMPVFIKFSWYLFDKRWSNHMIFSQGLLCCIHMPK